MSRLATPRPKPPHVRARSLPCSSCLTITAPPLLAVGRTFPSDAYTTVMLCELIFQYGWQRFSVIHSNSYAEGLRTNSGSRGLTLVVSSSYEYQDRSTYLGAVLAVRDSGVNVTVGVAWDQDILGIVRDQDILGTSLASMQSWIICPWAQTRSRRLLPHPPHLCGVTTQEVNFVNMLDGTGGLPAAYAVLVSGSTISAPEHVDVLKLKLAGSDVGREMHLPFLLLSALGLITTSLVSARHAHAPPHAPTPALSPMGAAAPRDSSASCLLSVVRLDP